jgi:hypothetical protein
VPLFRFVTGIFPTVVAQEPAVVVTRPVSAGNVPQESVDDRLAAEPEVFWLRVGTSEAAMEHGVNVVADPQVPMN